MRIRYLFLAIALLYQPAGMQALAIQGVCDKARELAPPRHWTTRLRDLFSRTLDQMYAAHLRGPKESKAFERRGLVLEGMFHPVVQKFRGDGKLNISPRQGTGVVYGGQRYVEFTNSTALKTTDPKTGAVQEFLLARGVRPYTNEVTPTGSQSPKNYVSDVLLFKLGKDGKPEYVKTILNSAPEKGFLFEDPRVSFLPNKNGGTDFFLSGTDYSSHVADSKNPDVMNRYVRLELDERGVPKAIPVGHDGKPSFFNLSPAPTLHEGAYSFIDAKNATIYTNEDGKIVVRTRLRPDFNAKWVKELSGGREWHYGEQVFVFDSFEDLQAYDWSHALQDVFRPGEDKDVKRIRPSTARIALTDKDLKEHFTDERVLSEKGKGMGPGAVPVRLERRGGRLYLSDAKGMEEHDLGEIPAGRLAGFPIPEGQVKYVTFDHEIRYFQDHGFTKRHYSTSIKLWDPTLTRIEAYYADAIQPTEDYERGVNTGVVDLHHVYPMGRIISKDPATGKTVVKVFAGASDAHTAQYNFDMMKLLMEMGADSERTESGQVYLPNGPTK